MDFDFNDGLDHHSSPESLVKAGPWMKNGHLCEHTPDFYKDHLLGTFHSAFHLNDAISLPSESIRLLSFKP